MTTDTALPPLLVTVLTGLVPLHIARHATLSEDDQHALAERAADGIAAGADRLVAPGNFEDHHERAAALNALAAGLAALAHHNGGVTWCGLHWCTAPHPDCPRTTRATEEVA